MGLSIGIVGLPNVGKSTTFNALTKAQNAQAANYPFCTIEPNRAIVPVPDVRLDELAKIVNPARVVNSTVEFVDIAGLVRGASKGEGLGNQFLGNVRECEAIVHIVRCFEDENVVHVHGATDPKADIEVINTELILADMQALEKKIQRLEKLARGDKTLTAQLETAQELMKHLDSGQPARLFAGRESEDFAELESDTHLITNKKVIYAANVNETALAVDNSHVRAVRDIAAFEDAVAVKLCAKFEEDLVGLEDAERVEFMRDAGATESGLEQVIRLGFEALGLISYFTAGPKEARAWTIQRGWKAPKAASVIHNDFERGFIRAEVISYEDYVACKGEQGAKAAGKMRVEGKDYIVQDGDVMHFLFSV